jgi:hypothetical protein
MIDVVAKTDLGMIPKDAESLRGWLAKATDVLPALCHATRHSPKP